jgi:hypothetical protein
VIRIGDALREVRRMKRERDRARTNATYAVRRLRKAQLVLNDSIVLFDNQHPPPPLEPPTRFDWQHEPPVAVTRLKGAARAAERLSEELATAVTYEERNAAHERFRRSPRG